MSLDLYGILDQYTTEMLKDLFINIIFQVIPKYSIKKCNLIYFCIKFLDYN
jgi:hypothetical protein